MRVDLANIVEGHWKWCVCRNKHDMASAVSDLLAEGAFHDL